MLNKVILQGRMARELELKHTPTGTPVCSFAVAVDRDYKSEDGTRECDFFEAVAWRENAKFVTKYFKKGDMVTLVGRLQTRKYEDKTGAKRTATEVIVQEFYFGGEKKEAKEEEFMEVPQGDDDFDDIFK